MKDYSNYKAEDFIQDEDFVDFLLTQNPNFLKNWDIIIQNESAKKEASIAKLWIEILGKNKNETTKDLSNTKEQIWNNILLNRQSKVTFLQKYWAAAAVLFVLIGASFYYILGLNNDKIVADYGAVKHFELPDSSIIDLYGNSSIEYGKKWNSENKREVWLTNGNAAFHIKHTAILNEKKISDSFRVHYKDYTMTVMGTIFSVSTRNEIISVTLKEGKVRINDANNPGFSKILLPGQTLIINPHNDITKSIKTPPTIETIKGEQELSINNKTVKDLLDYIQNMYGYRIQCNSPQLLDIKLEGTLPSENIDEIILALSNMINASIKKENTTIIINASN